MRMFLQKHNFSDRKVCEVQLSAGLDSCSRVVLFFLAFFGCCQFLLVHRSLGGKLSFSPSGGTGLSHCTLYCIKLYCWYCSVLYSNCTVLYCTVLYSGLWSTSQYNTVHHSTIQYSGVQYKYAEQPFLPQPASHGDVPVANNKKWRQTQAQARRF